jgi:GT2 family glycosyltransferase
LSDRPRVSVVIPSFNHARFLRAAVESVVSQDYPDVEILVMDGGSTDGSVEILRSYGDRIDFVSERDRGQADAINRGFARATGSVLGWLNSDDVYLPGAVRKAVAALTASPDASMVYGEGEIIDEAGQVLGPFIHTRPFDLWILVYVSDFILQPTVFMRAESVRAAGGLDESLHFGLDWDLWIRLACRGTVVHLTEKLAQSREYAATKTSTGGWRRLRELRMIMTRHGGRRWPPGARTYGLDTLRGRFPTLLGPSSLADSAELRTRVLPRLFRPLHRAMNTLIGGQTASYPVVWSDGWMGPRAYRAIGWSGQAGRLSVDVDVPPQASLLPFRFDVSAAGRKAEATVDAHGPVRVTLALPGSGGGPRPLEIVLRASRSCRMPGDPRRLSCVLRRITFREDGENEKAQV